MQLRSRRHWKHHRCRRSERAPSVAQDSDERPSVRRLFRREPAVEVDDELAFHIEMRTRELVETGVPEREARERALARFGSLTAAREECVTILTRKQRSLARGVYLREFVQDARYAARTLRREPRFTAGVLIALALGMGAATAVFSVVEAVVLRPLPYADPERLMRLSEVDWTQPDDALLVSPANYLDWSKELKSFSAIAATGSVGATTLTSAGEPVVLKVAAATASLIEVLGVAPRAGRWFRAEEDRAGSAPVVVLAHALWRQRFGGDERVIGSRVVLDGVPVTVIGIMPAGFEYPAGAELWRPLFGMLSADFTTIRHYRFLDVVGRIHTTASVATARGELDRVATAIAAAHPR